MTSLEELLFELLAIDASTGREAALAARLQEIFEARGYSVERQPVEGERFNLAVNADAAKVLFSTHLDTVPPHFPPREEGGKIHGRGACDAKGPLCAMIAAGDRLRADGIDDFGYLLVVGEEVDACGAKAANARYRSDYLLGAEPTERKLVAGHKSVVKFWLEVEGVLGHSAYPELARSAIHDLLDLLQELRAIEHGSDELLGEPTLNIGLIEGGRAANVIADRARALCMLRGVEAVGKSVARIEALAAARASIEWVSLKEPARMMMIDGFESCVVNFSSDIPHMGDIGRPLLFGPGSILQAHTADEFIEKAELSAAVDDYVRLVKLLRSRKAAG